jgi:hypothetical protein
MMMGMMRIWDVLDYMGIDLEGSTDKYRGSGRPFEKWWQETGIGRR